MEEEREGEWEEIEKSSAITGAIFWEAESMVWIFFFFRAIFELFECCTTSSFLSLLGCGLFDQ